MNITNPTIKKILQKYKSIKLASEVGALLSWDQNVTMPDRAAVNRARQVSLMEEYVTNMWNNPTLKSMVNGIDAESLNDDELAIVRNIKHATKYYYQVPKKLILQNADITARAFSVWQRARQENDYKSFVPYLREIVSVQRDIADHLGYAQDRYDALLDRYEPGLTGAQCDGVFSALQPAISELLRKIIASDTYKKSNPLMVVARNYPLAVQQELGERVLGLMGYDMDRGRLDVSAHPFTTELGAHDVRITTRYLVEDFRSAYTSTIHEAGHALYELGVNPEYELTPLAGGVSLGIHESQSRFWENQIGRSEAFLTYLLPVLQSMFGKQLSDINISDLSRHINHVQPGLIRVEADEVTYNLHIIIRFEIEQAMINGDLAVEDIPEMWSEKMNTYLGVKVRDNRDGCMQDVHWSYGSIGYFPTYTLGNLNAAQITHAMNKDINIPGLSSRGELMPIRTWLTDKLHIHGSRYYPNELIKMITAESLDPQYFIDYLNTKYSSVYEL